MWRVRGYGVVPESDNNDDPDVPSSGGLDLNDFGGGGELSPTLPLPRVPATPDAVVSGGRAGGRRGPGLGQIAADRPIFTLSVAADLLGLHPRTLRIYEEKGLVVPARTEGNRRRYSQNDIQRFQFIRQLTRNGVNLEGVRIILDMADELTKLGGDPAGIIERNPQLPPSDEP